MTNERENNINPIQDLNEIEAFLSKLTESELGQLKAGFGSNAASTVAPSINVSSGGSVM